MWNVEQQLGMRLQAGIKHASGQNVSKMGRNSADADPRLVKRLSDANNRF